MKLSERLEAACTGVLVAEATGNLDIVTDAVNKLLDAAREAAALARRVEGAAVVEMPSRPGPALQGSSLVIGAAAAERMGLAGQRVRIVPEDGQEVQS